RAAAAALVGSGAEVLAWDDAALAREAARAAGIPIVDLGAIDWRRPAALILSPGIPHSFPQPHPIVARARAAGCPVIGDIELLVRARREAGYVGITGTNGKSTTTALVGHILAGVGRAVAVGGNLGTPVLSFDALGAGGVYVLEMSSYQLELTPSAVFDVAVLLNLSPDHLDRHGGMAGYVAAKRRIFENQTRVHVAVVGIDDDATRAIADELTGAGRQIVRPISGERAVKGGVYVVDGALVDDSEGARAPVMDLTRVSSLPGRHNHQNAAAAYATARALGLGAAEIAPRIASFPGLAHRQERVAEIDGVVFVNDSKATNADAAARALGCYPTIYWIAGGVAKDGGITTLTGFFARIRHAYLIGEAAPAFAETLGDVVPHTIVGDLESAVRAAFADARAADAAGAVVLLSPACASFDQYPNFEVRGDHFRRVVAALPRAA
ncbi:MAG: UDP-N-acetylmuramoyl-L-alanine--D-glutamate ligase, partial [Proteobacteria bacterium]|nr:UDP-N-acetylmuramoyl-L-alanine--D-glutamate ligase [Pseudomonadota bacterium]